MVIMSGYLNHDEIVEFCERGGMLDWDQSCVNAASLDVRLGKTIMVERVSNRLIDYRAREKLDMEEIELDKGGFAIAPGQFFLAHTVEKCNFPDDVAALFRIKSSMGRVGLEHMDAGWVDPGFNGSLTLEFKLMTSHHWLLVRPGDKVGQLVFIRGNEVSKEQSYRTKGNYNGADGIKQVGYK